MGTPQPPQPEWRRYLLWAIIWVAFVGSLGYAASYGGLDFLENAVSVTAEPNRDRVKLSGDDPVIQVKVTLRNNTAETVTLKAPSACKMFRWQVFNRAGEMMQSKTNEDSCPYTEVSALLPSGGTLQEFYSVVLVPSRYRAGQDYLVHYWYWGYEGQFQFTAE